MRVGLRRAVRPNWAFCFGQLWGLLPVWPNLQSLWIYFLGDWIKLATFWSFCKNLASNLLTIWSYWLLAKSALPASNRVTGFGYIFAVWVPFGHIVLAKWWAIQTFFCQVDYYWPTKEYWWRNLATFDTDWATFHQSHLVTLHSNELKATLLAVQTCPLPTSQLAAIV